MSWLLTEQLLALFLMMGAGWALVKLGCASPADARPLSALSVYIISPCALLGAYQIEWSDAVRDGLVLAFVAAIVVYVMLFAMSAVLERLLAFDEVERSSVIYSNAGNLIIPLVASVLGREQVIYTSAYLCVQNVFFWTHCRALMDPSGRMSVKKIVANPNLIAILLGAVLFFAGIKLPSIAASAVSATGATIGPINMIMIGMLFAGSEIRRTLTSGRVWLVAVCKMIVQPAVFVLVLALSPLKELAPEGGRVLLITLLATAAPCAAMVTQMAVLYGKRPDHAGAINVVSTLICVATMPLSAAAYLALQ